MKNIKKNEIITIFWSWDDVPGLVRTVQTDVRTGPSRSLAYTSQKLFRNEIGIFQKQNLMHEGFCLN